MIHLEAESAVLGSVLLRNGALGLATKLLHPSDFEMASNGLLFEAMIQMTDKGIAIDMLTLSAHLESANLLARIGGRARIVELAEVVPSAANIEHYATTVRNHAIRRRLEEAGNNISSLASQSDPALAVEEAQRMLLTVAKRAAPSKKVKLSDAMALAYSHVEAVHEKGSKITGISTGFQSLDHYLAGFHSRELVILAGRPGMGKTALATAFALRAARQKQGVLFFSLEMDARQLGMRVLGLESRVSLQDMRTATCQHHHWAAMAKSTGQAETLNMHIVDQSDLTISQLRTIAREHATTNEIGMVIVDYLQLVTAKAERREREVAIISAGLKALAKELDVVVVALSQLNRSLESRPNKRPHLGDLRESGGLEQDADVVLFVYRDEYYNEDTMKPGTAEVIVAKQRQGPTGTAEIGFIKERTQFTDIRTHSIGRVG